MNYLREETIHYAIKTSVTTVLHYTNRKRHLNIIQSVKYESKLLLAYNYFYDHPLSSKLVYLLYYANILQITVRWQKIIR